MTSKTSTTKQESSAKLSPIEQAVAAYKAAKGTDKVKLVTGLTDAMQSHVFKGEFDKAQEISLILDAIKQAKAESNKPKVNKAQLLANKAAILREALHRVESDPEFDTNVALTITIGDRDKAAEKLAAVRSVTRGKAGDRQGWVLAACAAIGDGNHTVNDLITKSGVQYPGSNTQPNGAVGDWHTTHEGETYDLTAEDGSTGTMTVGFDSGHTEGEKGHRVFIVTMNPTD